MIQWILYNQLHHDYVFDEVERILVLHSCSSISTKTSAWSISLNIYSKVVSYAAWKAFVDSAKDGDFLLSQSREESLFDYCSLYACTYLVVMDSCEAYVSHRLHRLKKTLGDRWITLDIRPNTQFLVSYNECSQTFDEPPVMESFYRWMRKKTDILMDDDKPQGWKRNYDKENRKFDRTFTDVTHLGFWESLFWQEACEYYQEDIALWGKELQPYIPVTRQESLLLLDFFVHQHLDRFGELEDAMYTTSDFVYHSLLSIPLNFWLLTPEEVIVAIESADSAINNKEWCIRQILGWREYMNQWFHYYKDEIYDQNFFNHTRDLPYRFWKPDKAPETVKKMTCMSHVLDKVDRLWYSHHIERLMIIGNFCLLVWYNPHHINKRFWEQYADAFERVVTPNVLGMSQYADGWKLATKPYVASANYVNKMSNYCKWCAYNPKEKYGDNACPLNYLYRKFVDTNKETFVKGRQSFIINHLKKIDSALIDKQTDDFIISLDRDAKDS